MKKSLLFTRPILFGLIMLFSSGWVMGQVFTEDFTVGTYTVTLGGEGTDGTTDYFFTTDGSNIAPNYIGADGNFFAGQDTDDSGIPNYASPAQLTWSSIDITGVTGMSFSCDFASVATAGIDDSDYLLFEYQVDAGSWIKLIAFENDGTQYNTFFLEDTDFDGDGDGDQLTSTFTTFTKPLTVSGTSLNIRITAAVNSGGEDFAIDNIILETVFVPSSTIIDFEVENNLYTASATEGTTQTDVFNRVNPNIGGNSTYIWACEDLTLSNPSITLDQIDITGASVFIFSADMLTPNTNDWDIGDELLITYSVDGGAYQDLLWVQSNEDGDAYNAPAALDLDFDGIGDDGEELPALVDDFPAGVGSNFETFITNGVAISGSTIDITLQFNGFDGTAEGIYLDDITIALSSVVPNVDPEITNITQTPAGNPLSTETVSVSADITDTDGTIATATLNWGTASGVLGTSIAMSVSAGDTYTVDTEIPVQVDGTTVFYEIEAVDNESGTTTSSEASYTVTDAATTTLPYTEPFTADLGNTYTYSVSGTTKEWAWISEYASMNGYNSGDLEEDWLILPGINFDTYYTESMTFDTWYKYGTDDVDNYLKLVYSTDYSGIGDPSGATWTELTYTQGAAEAWTGSGTIDLSSLTGTGVYIAFKYHYDSGSYRNWGVDNISISGDTSPPVIPYLEPFDADLGDCATFSVSGATKEWTWISAYASMNGYNTGDLEEDWLFLPVINFDNFSNELMTFDSWWKYGSDDVDNYLKLMYSTDYSGTGDPSSATWTELSFAQGAYDTWAPSGTIDLSSISGTAVYIAFKYHYNSGKYKGWGIDNISITEDSTPPTFISIPADGAIDVSVGTTITLTFDEAIRNIDDSEITNDLLIPTFLTLKDAAGGDVAYTATIDGDKKVIVITPDAVLNSSLIYYVAMNAVEDVADNASAPAAFSFTTEEVDITSPTFTTNPVDEALNVSLNTEIRFIFDEPIQHIGGEEITLANIASLLTFKKIDASGEDVHFMATIDDDKQVITLIPIDPNDLAKASSGVAVPLALDLDQVYYASIASVEDASGNTSTAGELNFTTPWWTLDFEEATGYTTSVPIFSDGSGDYFLRTDGSNISSAVEFTNYLGNYFFAAQDMDGEGATLPLELNIDDIDITDMRATIFSVYLAEDDDGTNQDWDPTDYVRFQYDVDNSGTFKELLWIANDGSEYNSAPSVDARFDGVGDNRIIITDEFTNVFADLDISGTTLDIKVILNLNSGDEDIAIDNISFYALEGIAPVITSIHEDVNVMSDDNCQAILPDYTADVIATDNVDLDLDITQKPSAGTIITGGRNKVTLTVTDDAGNTAEVSFNVAADDTNPVIVSIHSDTTVNAADGCMAILPDYRGEVVATDNCDSDLTIGQSHLPGKVIFGDKNAVTLSVFDDAGNSTYVTFNVRVVDNTAPVITSTHSDQIIDAVDQCESILPDYTASLTATDNCSSYVDVTQTPAAGISISHTTNEVTLTATDENGNSSEVIFNVAVVDQSAPDITCLGNQSVLADDTFTYTVSGTSFNPTTRDNCGVASLVNDVNNTSTLDGEIFQEGTTTVTWTATDYEGNVSTCSFDIVVGEVLNIGSLEANGISVYPNPTNAKINFEFETSMTREIKISDLAGRTVLMKIIADRTETFDLSSFDSGVYIVSIRDADKTITTRIVKH